MVIKNILIISLAIVFLTAGVFAFTPPSHTSNEILISINGYSVTLQEAIDNNFLKDWVTNPTQSQTESIPVGHPGADIKIYVDGKKDLQTAINDVSFCRDHSDHWTDALTFGHVIDDVTLGDGSNLQNRINNAEFCSYEWKHEMFGTEDWPAWASDACGTTTRTRDVWCQRSDGKTDGITSTHCGGDDGNDDKGNSKPEREDTDDRGGIDCGWNAYADTTTCSNSCGSGTYGQSRTCSLEGTDATNHCTNAEPLSSGGLDCDAGGIDCGWNAYTDTTICSLTCGSGTYGQSRTCSLEGTDATNHCTNTLPLSSGGAACNTHVCPVDCVGSWDKNVGDCSSSCAPGKYDKEWTTTTEAVGTGTACPTTTFVDDGGNDCDVGSATCGWGAEGTYGPCEGACGTGTKTKLKTCGVDSKCACEDNWICTGPNGPGRIGRYSTTCETGVACSTTYDNPKYNGYLMVYTPSILPKMVGWLFCNEKGQTYSSHTLSTTNSGTTRIYKYSDYWISKGAVSTLSYYPSGIYIKTITCV